MDAPPKCKRPHLSAGPFGALNGPNLALFQHPVAQNFRNLNRIQCGPLA